MLLSALPQAVLMVDSSLKVIYLNQSAEDLLGSSEAQIKGRSLRGWQPFNDYLCDLCSRVIESGESLALFSQILELPRESTVVTLHIVPLHNGCALITMEKQDGLQKLAALSAKNELVRATGIMAAMLAHEVKNPLSGIRGAAQLLQSELGSEQRQLAELICAETDRIRDLLNQVEIFSSGAPECGSINIHEVLRYVISIAKAGFAEKITFQERYDPSLPPVHAHHDLLVQMFLNLVKNAAEALAETSDPVITISTYYQGGYRLHSQGEGDVAALPIAIDIEDNGPGIASPLRDTLFEPFLSSKHEGRGLGLAIVAKIISDLGASIELGEKNDAGAKFTVRLAVAR
jgi:two-component system nitrogen regulation sensor histidine kinase GlnL